MNNNDGYIGVDLDRTLAVYDTWRGPEHIGEPIKPVLEALKEELKKGTEVKIFTARADDPINIPPIKKWLKDNGLPDLEITNIKGRDMYEFWDDRARQVIPNKGIFYDEIIRPNEASN